MPVKRFDNKLINEIKQEIKNSKDGIWLYELARKVKITPGSLHYIIFGRKTKNGKEYGGRFKNNIISIREGKNRKIKWKD